MIRLVHWFRSLSRPVGELATRPKSKGINRRRSQFRPQLESLEDRLCPSSTTILPISAFLAQQGEPGSAFVQQGGNSHVFTPPVIDELAWGNSTNDPGATTSDPSRFLWVDYTGQAAQYLLQNGGPNLHTTVTGFVTETPYGSTGLMEVTLNLEARNALTWVASTASLTSTSPPDAIDSAPLELGYRPQDLVANPTLTPALSDVHLQLTWKQNVGTALAYIPASINEASGPAGFAMERFDMQSWGTGSLDAGTTAGTPGQTAIVSTCQVADLTNASLPGTYPLPDGFFQEPIDLIPVASACAHVGYLNGTLFVTDMGNGDDYVHVTPGANGSVTLDSNLGDGAYPAVTRVVVALGNGDNHVQVGNLPNSTVDVVTFNGDNHITVGNVDKLVIHVGRGDNTIHTANTSPAAQFISVGGNGDNHIDADNAIAAEIIVAGNGDNHIHASGTSDFIEIVGNGDNHITDTGTYDLIWLGGDGDNNIHNEGTGSYTALLAGTGDDDIDGPFGTP